MTPLPIDAHVPEIVAAVRERGAVVVVAAPGAGKTTRVPPALLTLGPTILLQPRRIAARALARRIAQEQGWQLGEEVGWQVRFERRFGARTRLLVATEGILTARLQADPLLSAFRVVVIDEFHERSLHADLALALARQAARARGDLGLVVMSATLDAARVAAFLDHCPVIEVPGRLHPVTIENAPGLDVAAAARRVLGQGTGHVLCFLPGMAEIRRAESALQGLDGVVVLPLHGTLAAEAQDAALAPSRVRKLILATNLAETSLTVDGVTDVVDSGLQRVLRYEAERGIDRLQTERISVDSATQRAGRAGRTAPGRALRLWDPRERLAEHREPEIRRVDLSAPLLDVIAWGADPAEFEWFERPDDDAITAALHLLQRLGAIERPGGRPRLTPLGDSLRRLPLHPRLARVLVEAGGSSLAAMACALLSDRLPPRRGEDATDNDLLEAMDAASGATRASAREIAAAARRAMEGDPAADDPVRLRRALLRGYPDRVARRREPGSPRLVMASGHGAVMGRESGVHGGELLVALDLTAGARGAGSEALVRAAAIVEPDWLEGTEGDVEHTFDGTAVRAVKRTLYDRLVLSQHPVAADPLIAGPLLADALLARGIPDERGAGPRLRFAGLEVDLPSLVREACVGRTTLPRCDLADLLPHAVRAELDRLAPAAITVPSGRTAALEYREDGSVNASVKLQELFGLGDTPRVGPRREPVTLHLLAPNGRPVQSTRDLRSFWENTYPEVRRELRGRYPRHPWPEDPWTAEPTARTRRRR